MSNFTCPNSLSRIFFNIGPRTFSFAPPIVDIFIYISAKKRTETDQYSLSYGPAKFDVATTNFEPLIRRSVSLSISALWTRMIHQNVGTDVGYHRANREAEKNSASYLLIWYNAEVWSCHGWRFFGVCSANSRIVPDHNTQKFFFRPSPKKVGIPT